MIPQIRTLRICKPGRRSSADPWAVFVSCRSTLSRWGVQCHRGNDIAVWACTWSLAAFEWVVSVKWKPNECRGPKASQRCSEMINVINFTCLSSSDIVNVKNTLLCFFFRCDVSKCLLLYPRSIQLQPSDGQEGLNWSSPCTGSCKWSKDWLDLFITSASSILRNARAKISLMHLEQLYYSLLFSPKLS